MSESMVERVARAICAAKGGNPDSRPPYDQHEERLWQHYVPEARAAIEAMREPTRRMLDAGPGDPYMDEEVWAKMIDVALNEQVSG